MPVAHRVQHTSLTADIVNLRAVELHTNIYRPSLQLIGAPWLHSHKHELLTHTTLASITSRGGARLGSTGNNMHKKKRCQDSRVHEHLQALLEPTFNEYKIATARGFPPNLLTFSKRGPSILHNEAITNR